MNKLTRPAIKLKPLVKSAPTHLPIPLHERKTLIQYLYALLHILQSNEYQKNIYTIQIIELRIKLINSCSHQCQYRIKHLKEIFKHYCMHVGKTGKHITFYLLYYEKNHMTIERFFGFLKEFGLLKTQNDGGQQYVVDRNYVVRIFKRVSTNSKDLDFKQFLECIEAIAVIYFKDNNEDIHKLLRMYATNKVNNHFKITKKLETTDEIYDEFSISVQKGYYGMKFIKNSKDTNEKLVQYFILVQYIIHEIIDKTFIDKDESNKIIHQTDNEYFITTPSSKRFSYIKIPASLNVNTNLFQLTVYEQIYLYYLFINIDNANYYQQRMRKLNVPLYFNSIIDKTRTHRHSRRSNSLLALDVTKAIDNYELKTYYSSERKNVYTGLKDWKVRLMPVREKSKSSKTTKQYSKINKGKSSQKYPKNNFLLSNPVDSDDIPTDLATLSKMYGGTLHFSRFNLASLYTIDEDDKVFMREYSAYQTEDKQSRKMYEYTKRSLYGVRRSERVTRLIARKN